MYCSNCGKEIGENTKECPFCGAEIKESDMSDEDCSMNITRNEKKRSKSLKQILKKIFGVLIILFLAVGPLTVSGYGNITDAIIEVVQYELSVLACLVIPYFLVINYKGVRDRLPLFKAHKVGKTILASFITWLVVGMGVSCIVYPIENFHSEQYYLDKEENSKKDNLDEEKDISKSEKKSSVKDKTTKKEEETNVLLGDESEYIFPYSHKQLIKEEDLEGLSESEIQCAINEIYARHGRLFDDEKIQEYFNQKSWYRGHIKPQDFDDSCLNQIEKQNIEFLISQRAYVQSGDGSQNLNDAGYMLYDFEDAIKNPKKYIGQKVVVVGKVDYSYEGAFFMSYMQGEDTICTVNYDTNIIPDMPKKEIYDAVTVVYGVVKDVNKETGADIELNSLSISSHDIGFSSEAVDYQKASTAEELMSYKYGDPYYLKFIIEGVLRNPTIEEYNDYNYNHNTKVDTIIDLDSGDKVVLNHWNDEFASNYMYFLTTKESMLGKRVRIYGTVQTNIQYPAFARLGIQYMEPLE